MLELRDLRAGYGDAVVLDGISLALGEGASLAVLGRNGVGKSTLLLTIMGYTRLRRGDVSWRGRSILRLAPHERARLGIGAEMAVFRRRGVRASGDRMRWEIRAVELVIGAGINHVAQR